QVRHKQNQIVRQSYGRGEKGERSPAPPSSATVAQPPASIAAGKGEERRAEIEEHQNQFRFFGTNRGDVRKGEGPPLNVDATFGAHY
ncbi:hypothetical protein U1Q18_026437, partial [Sarracenia purpurea var. burkii]